MEKLLLRDRLAAELKEQKKARAERTLKRQERVDEALRRRTAAKLEALDNIRQALEA